MHPIERLKLLLEPDRLAVAGRLAVAPGTTDDLIEATGLDRRVVIESVGALRGSGLVVADGGSYRIDPDALRAIAGELANSELPMDPIIGYGMTDDERAVLSRFFEGRVLREIPTSRAKRLIVFERLVLEFEAGRRYRERDVDAILGAFHADWSALRRYMVDEGFLGREHADGDTLYWRTGGRFTDLPVD